MTTTSPVAGLVDELEALGAQLWEEGGQLRFRAPRGVMTDERRAALRASRGGLLDYLRGVEAAVVVPEPASRYEPFPLSDIQSAYVLGRRGADVCRFHVRIRLEAFSVRSPPGKFWLPPFPKLARRCRSQKHFSAVSHSIAGGQIRVSPTLQTSGHLRSCPRTTA